MGLCWLMRSMQPHHPPAFLVAAGCSRCAFICVPCLAQSGVARIGEEWLYEYYGNQGSNVKVVTVYPGSMYTDFARHTMPGTQTC